MKGMRNREQIKNSEALNLKGLSLIDSGKRDEAIKCFNEAIAIDSKRCASWGR